MGQGYILYLILSVILLAAVFVIWRLSKRRRDVVAPAPEAGQPSPIPPGEKPAARPGLKLVSPATTAEAAAPRAEGHRAEEERSLQEGLAKTRGGFISRLAGLLGSKKIDAALLGQVEEVLLTADIGVKTSQKLFEAVRTRLSRNELSDADVVWAAIREESRQLLRLDVPALDLGRARPLVLLTIGVNGVGKTTTIGKLAARWRGEGKKVLLAAGDTFRAAAAEQLEIWGERVGAPVIKGKEGGDPSAVIFDAIKRAKAEEIDIVIADTAGRLHTKSNLMEELQKVRRVVQKADPTAPHETWLVLDATNGQNAIAQAQMFKQTMDITGIVLTKLDGTAKGGVILGISDELKVPVRFIGIGEKAVDLRPFDADEFVDALYGSPQAA
ncbi:MAG TPA: signal recognition particle-docking protein FtsY [Polyangia bacterium]|nr:signal recognition particle-docking protein FtsY [Polyangia bacterium]